MPACDFCGNFFSSKNSLETHKKKAVYCLKLRGQPSVEEFSEKGYISLKEQIQILEQQLKMKDQQIKFFQEFVNSLTDKLENIAIQSLERYSVENVINEVSPSNKEECRHLIE